MNPSDKISKYFTWREAIYLPSWNRLANEQDGLTEEIKQNLIKTFQIMDIIREFLGKPIIVNCAYRPPEYNKLIGGAKRSKHLRGLAVDWHIKGKDCDLIRIILNNKAVEWNIRIEDLKGSVWLHIDIPDPGQKPGLFKP